MDAALRESLAKPVTFKFDTMPWGVCLTFASDIPWTPSEHETLMRLIFETTHWGSHYLTSYCAEGFLDPMQGIAASGREPHSMSNGF
ncbi:hypothetical protein I302_105314 [Kwoniella bestiolae CBS 10118]|uniref:Uncharacterized protein n=1 Tax=Kwoniella bestiolae CBS 10118 TaxID=1296100 RepID=A0A1B9FSU4_9TREE|nr:hypothetical protein I302_08599 [Kwoniella bestiolae CBS 10118]OCF21820.1 hypothetical protein I302_08599 [Kwoniella bestiolae CBS 10118]